MADYLEISDDMREKIAKHYANPEIIKIMLDASTGKEVVGSFGGVGYARRPNTISYENDITLQVKQGVTSFHISEETWRNPLELAPGLDKKKLNTFRSAWDLIIDIDCPHWEICKLITHLLVQEIKNHYIDNVSVKFSGNKGFHIGIPSESFIEPRPEEFPDLPKKIAEYLLDRIKPIAAEHIRTILVKEFGEDDFLSKAEELFHKPKTQLFDNHMNLVLGEVVEVDTILLSARHLYRMVYSVNEKSGLVSLPINPDKILQFEKHIAKIENGIISRFVFLDRTKSERGEAETLVMLSLEHSSTNLHELQYEEDFKKANEDEKSDAEREYEEFKETIPERYFPDSIKKLLAAEYSDGKKRALFILRNFFSCAGWQFDDIEKRLYDWNKDFNEPLRETILKGQLIYLKGQMKRGEKIMPPNFMNNQYYADIIGDHPDYKKARNPVSLAIRFFKAREETKKQEQKVKQKQEKEAKRQEKEMKKKEKELQKNERDAKKKELLKK